MRAVCLWLSLRCMLLSATSTHFKWELMLYCLHCPTLNKILLLLLLLLLPLPLHSHSHSHSYSYSYSYAYAYSYSYSYSYSFHDQRCLTTGRISSDNKSVITSTYLFEVLWRFCFGTSRNVWFLTSPNNVSFSKVFVFQCTESYSCNQWQPAFSLYYEDLMKLIPLCWPFLTGATGGFSLNKLLTKQSRCLWFVTSRSWCDITLMRLLAIGTVIKTRLMSECQWLSAFLRHIVQDSIVRNEVSKPFIYVLQPLPLFKNTRVWSVLIMCYIIMPFNFPSMLN